MTDDMMTSVMTQLPIKLASPEKSSRRSFSGKLGRGTSSQSSPEKSSRRSFPGKFAVELHRNQALKSPQEGLFRASLWWNFNACKPWKVLKKVFSGQACYIYYVILHVVVIVSWPNCMMTMMKTMIRGLSEGKVNLKIMMIMMMTMIMMMPTTTMILIRGCFSGFRLKR